MRPTPSIVPERVSRLWCTGTDTSPLIVSGVCSSRSSDRLTAPSVEFSTGTTPKSAVPASAARNTSSIDTHGTGSIDEPKCRSKAISENVPGGPR